MSAQSGTSVQRRQRVVLYLILDVQRTHLPVEELQGLHVSVSGCVVDSVGSTLKKKKEKNKETINSRIHP